MFFNRAIPFHVGVMSLCLSLLLAAVSNAQEQSSKAPPLSPADSIKTMKVQPGYRVIPVLTEPQIHEPSVIAWDGNGRMYVVEMRTYMQDIDGKNQLASTSRVSRHEDSDGDGVYDKHTIFADNLSLPRMVLPLLDRVIIRETNTFDLKSYQDTDDDGVADKIEVWHEGGSRGGNLEHQPSGLIWNIDNWIYTTYSAHRYRFTNGTVVRENMLHGAGQWGLTHDNVGRIFYSLAGGENPATDFQQPIVYGQISLPGEQADGFREVFPIDNIPDTQGGRGRLRDDNTLNRFSASCGQSIYRGDRLPNDFDGDLIICEPVGRLVRRAKVINDRGRIVVDNAYDESEFIAATDPNFRPINSATGPDGCLYLVDMYRGIIQEGSWVRDGSYLRGVVEEFELEKNIGRGRIFRIEHETTNRGPTPRMLEETPSQLVEHLSHPNGWWRSEAQKLIVLHGNKNVAPKLRKMVTDEDSPLGRLHALWTLEGLGAVDSELLAKASADSDPRVRAAAMRIAEPFLAEDRSLDDSIAKLVQDDDPNVAIQVLLSASRGSHPAAERIEEQIREKNPDNMAIQGIAKRVRDNMAAIIAERKKLAEIKRRNKVLAESIVRGKSIYASVCITCHGQDGKGVKAEDNALMLAPPLAGSSRVRGHKERLTRILISGLIGPVDGKNYASGLMQPMGSNSDQWIADVATYVRNSWGNQSPLIEATDVNRIRESTASRAEPWTLSELGLFDPPNLLDRDKWKLTASNGQDKIKGCIDGNRGSRWDTGQTQRDGMWFQIEFPDAMRVMSLTLDTRGSNDDYPRQYTVHVSSDGKEWGESVAYGRGSQPLTEIELSKFDPIKFVRIDQTGHSPNKYWSIHELGVKGLPGDADLTIKSLSQNLSEENVGDLAAAARKLGDAKRGAAIFFNPALSCAKCHEPATGNRIGPDLASVRDGVNDELLVDSILRPSKNVRKGFEQLIVYTFDGLTVSGFPIEETEKKIVLREPAGGKEITILRDDIEETEHGTTSMMPAGLANQLGDRQQFLDLMRFLMEVNEGGRTELQSLKPTE